MADKPTNKERLKELGEKIEAGIREVFDSDKYAEYLKVMSRFPTYSVNNQMLIRLQRPNATKVAGYNKWQQFERHVKRGEHGITIIAPTPYKKKIEEQKLDPDTKAPVLDANGKVVMEEQEIEIPTFRPIKVFDYAQTEGKPLSELVHKLTGDVADYERMTEAICALSPYPINIEAFPGAAYGCCNFVEQRILVQPDMSQVQTIKTMIHEVSHAKLHAPIEDGDGETPPQRKRRFVREMEAESVAYVVCQHFGIDTADYSFGYVAGWSHGKDLSQLKASLELIRNTAAELIDGIDPPKELPPPTQKKQRTKRRNAYERS